MIRFCPLENLIRLGHDMTIILVCFNLVGMRYEYRTNYDWSGIVGGIFAPCLSIGSAIGSDIGSWLGIPPIMLSSLLSFIVARLVGAQHLYRALSNNYRYLLN